jgi:hypothetical protein
MKTLALMKSQAGVNRLNVTRRLIRIGLSRRIPSAVRSMVALAPGEAKRSPLQGGEGGENEREEEQ